MFTSEKELVKTLKTNSKKILQKILHKKLRRHFLIEEYDSNFGVADIVLGTYKPFVSKNTIRPPINKNWINPLIKFNLHQSLTFDELQEKYLLSPKGAKQRINDYMKAGFLIESSTDQYTVIKTYQGISDQVIAIEAKLKNWKRALIQAKRYYKFADKSFVALDETFSDSATKNINEFKKENVGLITLNQDTFKIIYSPKNQKIKKSEYSARLNEEVHFKFKNL